MSDWSRLPFKSQLPKIDAEAFVAPGAAVIGDVEIGRLSSLWFGVVARGDVNEIRIGARSNIQDGTVIHVASRGQGTYVGDNVTVGHRAVLHACTLDESSFIGIQACLLDGVHVERHAMVAAGAVVTPGKRVASGELWAGVPARMLRRLSVDEIAFIDQSAQRYVDLAQVYLQSSRGG